MKIVKYFGGEGDRKVSLPIIGSETIYVGGFVKLAAGGVAAADAQNDLIYGICKGFKVANGNTPIEQALSSDYDGTLVADTSYTAAADNLTDKMVKAEVEVILPGDILRGEADAALGTTTGSNKPGYSIDLLVANHSKLDESEAHATDGQLIIVGTPTVAGTLLLDVQVKAATRQI